MEISDLLLYFVYALTTIFVIVNPIEATLVFVTLTCNLNSQERRHIYRRTTLVAFVIAILFALAGDCSFAHLRHHRGQPARGRRRAALPGGHRYAAGRAPAKQGHRGGADGCQLAGGRIRISPGHTASHRSRGHNHGSGLDGRGRQPAEKGLVLLAISSDIPGHILHPQILAVHRSGPGNHRDNGHDQDHGADFRGSGRELCGHRGLELIPGDGRSMIEWRKNHFCSGFPAKFLKPSSPRLPPRSFSSCENCGECCRGEGYALVDEADLQEIARTLAISPSEARARFTDPDPEKNPGCRILKSIGPDRSCCLLDVQAKRCMIYSHRPRICRTFPMLNADTEGEEYNMLLL